MNRREWPQWLIELDDEDLQFIRRFVLASGSLKALAKEYGVSYPTLRSRLDRLIATVKSAEETRPEDAFQRTLRLLVANGQVKPETARRLMDAHRDSLKTEENSK